MGRLSRRRRDDGGSRAARLHRHGGGHRQPWWFGEPFFKATGFYRRGLPPLVPTNRLTPPRPGTEAHKAWSAIHRASPGPDRWKIRSRTFAGIAEAIAEQWGGHAEREAAA
ncbi:MAG: hypothetical protein JG765_2174 [Cereibacter sp.]|nr:hypothetical protein [Cereibacter sp.]